MLTAFKISIAVLLKSCEIQVVNSKFSWKHLKIFCSYFNEDERGLFPECQFVFDLELPPDFVPKNTDGEVENFKLVSMEKVS